MTWFSASLIFLVKLRSGEQRTFPAFETVFLISARDFDEANLKAEAIGRAEAEAGDDLSFDDKPAYKLFLGIRKLKGTHNLQKDVEIGSARPDDGTEIIESYFELESMDELEKLAAGKRVTITYVDDDA